MLLQEKHKHIQTDGVIETQDFGIVFNEKMVKILSDGLYSDKVLAILRELSANAYDAHVQNNCADKPFEVHLPTLLNPVFYIRDYGLGLSPDDVKTIYTVYGMSNKETSNDYIGCLGLGSKTPFAYNTRSATVEVWRDGIHYIYSTHLNDKGMPILSKLSETTSTEPSGVKISIAANKNDISNFQQKAAKLYRYFKVPPTIKGNSCTIVPVKYIFQGTNWALRDTNNLNDNPAAVATMGNLAYPISFQDTNLSTQVKELLNCRVDFFFKIGDLDIEASREGLSYDTRTKGNISKIAKDAVAEIEKIVTDKIDSAPSLWDARVTFHKVKAGLPQNFLQVLGINNIKWKGEVLFNSNSYYHSGNAIDVSEQITKIHKPTYRNKLELKATKTIVVDDNLVFVKNDLKTGGQTRVREYLYQNTDKTVIYLNFTDALICDKVIKEIGLLPSHIVLASSFPKPTKVKIGGGPGTGVKRGHSTPVMKWVSSDLHKTKCWSNMTHDLTLGGVYVEINQFNVVNKNDKNKSHHPRNIGELVTQIDILGITKPDILGIKTQLIPRLLKSKATWTHFNDWCEQQVTPLMSKYDYQSALAADDELKCIHSYDHTLNCYTFDVDEILEIGKLVNQTTEFYKFYSAVLECQKISADLEKCLAINTLVKLLNLSVKPVTYKSQDINKIKASIYKKYHLLNKIAAGDITDAIRKDTAKYINVIG